MRQHSVLLRDVKAAFPVHKSWQRIQAPREQVDEDVAVMMADENDWQGCQCTVTTQEWCMDQGEKMPDI